MIQTVDRALQYENFRSRWYTNQNETTVKDLFHIRQRLHMTIILIVTPMNNAVDVIKERLLDDIPLFNKYTLRCDCIYPYYRRIMGETDIRNVPCANILQRNLEKRLPMEMIDKYVQCITLCTLGSVYRAFSNTDHGHRHRNVLPFNAVIIDEASQTAYSDFSILFDHINRCLTDQNLDA